MISGKGIILFISVLLQFIVRPVNGQTTEAATNDATLLMQGYFEPFGRANGIAMSGGWYNTGKTLKPFEIQIHFAVQLINIPEKDLMYRTDNIGLLGTIQTNGNHAPTFFGKSGDANRPEYQFTDPGTGDIALFTGPEGIDLQNEWKKFLGIERAIFPFPVVQLRSGLPFGSSIMFRLLPNISLSNDTDFRSWGIGISHSISQYFSKDDNPALDVTLVFSYSKLSFNTDLRTDEITIDNDIFSSDGEGIQTTNSWNIQLMAAKKWRSLTIYGGPSYFLSGTSNMIDGTFNYTLGDEQREVTDPISYRTIYNRFRFSLGLNVEVSVFNFFGCFNFASYNSADLGFAIQF